MVTALRAAGFSPMQTLFEVTLNLVLVPAMLLNALTFRLASVAFRGGSHPLTCSTLVADTRG